MCMYCELGRSIFRLYSITSKINLLGQQSFDSDVIQNALLYRLVLNGAVVRLAMLEMTNMHPYGGVSSYPQVRL